MRFGQGKNRWNRCLVMMMIAMQTGVYTPYAQGTGQPVIPGYYGKDAAGLVPPSVTALPVVRDLVRNATLSQATETELVVHQSADHAVIDWESFDIGASAHTRFDQQGHAAWSVLNRIHDQNPSQIYGSLTADGAVYLINPNGMLFSEGARINVHSLVASSLAMDEDDFLSRTIAFTSQGADGLGPTADDARVENRGTIETDVNGSVYLLSPQVVNSGSIEAPVGRIVLAAGTEMSFHQEDTEKVLIDHVNVTSDSPDGNLVINESGGRISASLGKIEMYGSCVNQQGLVRSVTAIKKDGEIILKATDRIITGEDSQTLNLISDSDEEVHDSFDFQQGTISLTAGNIIEHQGTLVNPAGKLNLSAGDRIYLGDQSRIDVAGVTVDQGAEDSLVTVTLNSVELKDDQHQKDGILRGEEIAFVREDGSAIGDVVKHLDKEFKTAVEAAVSGGQINLSAPDGDIIVRDGASLDFSGGSAHHESGFVDTTWLASGSRAFSISEASDTRRYDSILGSYEKTYARYGITESFSGLYTGGAAPVRTLIRDYHTGADAGLLTMKARTIVLDGDLDGTTLPGFYQTQIGDPKDELMRQIAAGVGQPAGGIFRIDQGTSQIVVSADTTPLPSDFDADSSLPETLVSDYATDTHPLYKTLLSSKALNGAGLSVLSLNALTRIDIETGAEITLDPAKDSQFYANARTITVDGTVSVPAGMIHMKTITNASSNEASPDYVSTDVLGPERIYVGEHAVLSVAGETVNNALVRSSGEAYQSAHVSGGTIILEEKTLDSGGRFGEGVILRQGSVLDVSGGYEIGVNGDLTAGAAGDIRLQGANLILDGDLRAWSLEGQTGGTIELIAETVIVVPEDIRQPLPETFGQDDLLGGYAHGLILDDNCLDQTGAAELLLRSFLDLTVESGTELGVSHIKVASPLSGRDALSGESVGRFEEVTADALGKTVITLAAGQKSSEDVYNDNEYKDVPGLQNTVIGFANDVVEKKVVISETSEIATAPLGSITVNGPGVAIFGILEAPAGAITVTATSSQPGMELLLGPTARLLARGYLTPDGSVAEEDGALAYLPLDGGNIVLESDGMLRMNEGSLVDVSAPDTVVRVLTDEQGRTVRQTVAANPGSVSITFMRAEDGEGQTTLAGTLRAENAGLDGVTGGDLSIRRTHTTAGLDLSEAMIQTFLDGGFDALSFRSDHSLAFTGPVDLDVGRVLTLDTPEIRASGEAGQTVDLSASAVHLVNSRIVANTDPRMAVTGGVSLTLASDGYLDIDGRMVASGFETVTLTAARDILVQDRKYTDNLPAGFPLGYYGELDVNGDLTLSASRISPTTASVFTLHSDRTLTTNRGDDAHDGALYSAGGRLVVEAEDIVHGGVFSAPMGEIVLRGIDGTRTARSITLESGSVIAVGGDQPVYYGTYDPDTMVWKKHPRVIDRDGLAYAAQAFEEPNERSITITGATVRSDEGSRLDVSGGGALYTYLFQRAVEGSVDPLNAAGARVLMPEAAVSSPGERIYLSGRDGVRAGYYVVVGEEYAFTDGALVVRDLGPAASLSACQATSEGYTVAVGYDSAEGQNGHGSQALLFEVRSAADVLKEGNYSYTERAVSDAGILSILAATNLLSATLNGWGAADGKGASVALSGTQVIVGETDLEDLTGTLVVDPDSLSGSGFTDLTLGHDQSTESVRVTENSVVSVENLTLAARDLITVEAGAAIDTGHDGTGTVSLLTEDGHLALETGARVTAGEHLTLSGASMDIDGTIGVEAGTLTLESDAIAFTSQGSNNGTGPVGLTVGEDLWTMISGISALEFLSRSDMTLDRGLALHGQRSLLLDTATLSVIEGPGGAGTETMIAADNLTLSNSGAAESGALFPAAGDPAGDLTLEGRTDLTVAFAPRADNADETGVSRTLTVSGVGMTHLSAGETLGMEGQGTLSIDDGNLDLKAPVVTGVLSRVTGDDGETIYKTPDARVSVENGDLSISSKEGEGLVDSVGGSLAFSARKVTHTGRIVLPAGHVSMNATGGAEQAIVLVTGSLIDVSGTETAPAGAVSLGSDHGKVSFNAGATIDASAGTDGRAGSLTIRSPEGESDLAGALVATGGGGSLWVDVLGTSDAAALVSSMAGLDGTVYLRSRTGHLDLTSHVTASDLTLVADQGDITLRNGVTVDASGETGGGIGLFAGENLTLETNSVLDASGSAGNGGTVDLAARRGNLAFADGATITVGGSEGHDGGTVSFRARRVGGDEVSMDLDGTIAGASAVTAEARTTESRQTVDAAAISTLRDETQAYMAAATAAGTRDRLLSGLTLDDPDQFHVTPGIEIQSAGDLDLTTLMDLNTFLDQVGTLTLKADGDLTLTRSLVSHPTALADLVSGGNPDSWNITLVAGADVSSAHDLSVKDGGSDGTLTVSDGAMVYSESGDIRFASRLDTVLGTGAAQTYSVKNAMNCAIATFDGDIEGKVSSNLSVTGSAIQSGTGDIDLSVGGDLRLNRQSGIRASIRTTGEAPATIPVDYFAASRHDLTFLYANGGDIQIRAAGSIDGSPASGTWGDNALVMKTDGTRELVWSANYGGGSTTSTGIVTMGGGDVNLSAGGNITAQTGAFGEGDLTVRTGGDLNGRFMVSEGTGRLFSAGSFGTLARLPDQTLELMDGTMSLYAQGRIILGSVVSPSLVDSKEGNNYYWNPGFTETSAATVQSGFGNISISGFSGYVATGLATNYLPPSLTLNTGADLHVTRTLSLFPSPDGNLCLTAGGSIYGYGNIINMADIPMNEIYEPLFELSPIEFVDHTKLLTGNIIRNSDQLHRNDTIPVRIDAGGDIDTLRLFLPKKAEITAGRDMVNLVLTGQNLREGDLTLVKVGRDIVFGTTLGASSGINNAIELSGPGSLAVLAGGSIDLGTSTGIVSDGNAKNSDLPSVGSDVVVICGYDDPFALADPDRELFGFFGVLREEGKLYSDALGEDDTEVDKHVDLARDTLRATLGEDYATRPGGNIDMIRSRIATTSGGDIAVLAAGDINVGQTVIGNKSELSNGINTQAGGDIRVFSVGDMNINESRLMTWFGGDITLWADLGDINAGRGSRTEISPGSTTVKTDAETGIKYVAVVPAASGSGIRALTYDPDGLEGPLAKADLGDVFLFAPTGIIDAGEAGIAGNSVYLGARTVLNVQNISFSQGAVGVPMGSENSVNLGAITGAGGLSAANQISDSASALAAVNKAFADSADKMADTFLPTWLRVEFMGFDVDDYGR